MDIPKIQWYPGHIAKAEKKLSEVINRVDLVIEVRDARIPLSTGHPHLNKWIKDKKHILVINKANLKGKSLTLQLGFSHDIDFPIPDGVNITVEKQTTIKIKGNDKQQVGMIASKIKSFRPPEPYKGKGIKEKGQYILRKEGKKK